MIISILKNIGVGVHEFRKKNLAQCILHFSPGIIVLDLEIIVRVSIGSINVVNIFLPVRPGHLRPPKSTKILDKLKTLTIISTLAI